MKQHDSISLALDLIDGLRPDDEKEEGSCFGSTLVTFYHLFAGNLETFIKTIQAIHEKIQHAKSNQTVASAINDIQKNPNMMAILSSISIAQYPFFHQMVLCESEIKQDQTSNISLLFDFLSFGLKRQTTQAMRWPMLSMFSWRRTLTQPLRSLIHINEIFTAFFSREKLAVFLMEIDQHNQAHNLPIGIIFLTMDHAKGCGYDPERKSWFMTEIRNDVIIEYVDHLGRLASRIINEAQYTYSEESIFGIIPILHANSTLSRVFNSYHRAELKKIKYYENVKLIRTFLYSISHRDLTTQKAVLSRNASYQNMNTFDIISRLSHHKKDVITSIIKENDDDLTCGCIAICENEINMRDSLGDTPLICSIKQKKTSLSEWIISHPKCDLSIPDCHGISPFTHAIMQSEFRIACLILGKLPSYITPIISPMAENRFNWDAIHYAARFDQLELLKLLVQRKVNINLNDHEKWTPLHVAITSDSNDIVEFLCDQPAINLEATNSFGRTPLHYAAMHGSLKSTQKLLEKGANKWAKDINGNTPLHLAALNRHTKICTLLSPLSINLSSIVESPQDQEAEPHHTKTLRFLENNHEDTKQEASSSKPIRPS